MSRLILIYAAMVMLIFALIAGFMAGHAASEFGHKRHIHLDTQRWVCGVTRNTNDQSNCLYYKPYRQSKS